MLIGDRRGQEEPVEDNRRTGYTRLTLVADLTRLVALGWLMASPFVADDLAVTLSWGFAFVGLAVWRV